MLKSDPYGQGDRALLDNETVMIILDPALINNHIRVKTLDGINTGYIDIKHLYKVQSTDWVRNSTPSLAPSPQSVPPPGPPPQQSDTPTYVYRILINIGSDGIRLRSQPFDESKEDGARLYSGQYVTHNVPAFRLTGYVHVYAHPQAQGYIHIKYLGDISFAPPPVLNPPPPPLSLPPYVPPLIHQDPASGKWYMVNPDGTTTLLGGGLRRRKFRSHKKRHIKSRPRSNKSRSKKSCSRRR